MYQGKDRVFYKTLEERAAADARYEQNRLLKEQNDLIRKQQQDAVRMQRQTEQKAQIEAQMERARIAQENFERKLEEIKESVNEKANKIICNHIPAMKAAGIGDPSAYIIKMIEVYKEDEDQYDLDKHKVSHLAPIKQSLECIDNTKAIAIQEGWGMEEEKLTRIDELCTQIQQIKKKYQKPLFLLGLLTLPFLIWGMIEGISYGFDDLFEAAGSFIILGIIMLSCVTLVIIGKSTNEVEPFFNEYNRIITDAYDTRESRKLVKLERRRLENFNFNLEYELILITNEFMECNKILEEQGFGVISFPDFRWRFFDYPQEFVEYYNKISENDEKKETKKRKNAGLDIFDDL